MDNEHDSQHIDFKERFIRLEEKVTQWIQFVEKRLSLHQAITLWMIGLIGTALVGLVLALLTRGL